LPAAAAQRPLGRPKQGFGAGFGRFRLHRRHNLFFELFGLKVLIFLLFGIFYLILFRVSDNLHLTFTKQINFVFCLRNRQWRGRRILEGGYGGNSRKLPFMSYRPFIQVFN